jgi:DNA-binding CsgD family transcriptional regulator
VLLGEALIEALDRMCYGGIVLDETGEVLKINNSAVKFLQDNQPEDQQRNFLDQKESLKGLLRSNNSTRLALKEDSWAVIERDRVGKRPLVLHVIPIGDSSAFGPRTIIIMVDLDDTPRPMPDTLQKIFGLTPTEAKLAIEIACGKSLDDIAKEHRTSIATVRKHLASLFAKTHTHRQADLMALLARVSILP